jgi:hypothetical protein
MQLTGHAVGIDRFDIDIRGHRASHFVKLGTHFFQGAAQGISTQLFDDGFYFTF